MNKIGIDEVGRGCLAGPVIACALIFIKDHNIELDDSKKLSLKKRLYLEKEIKKVAIYDFGIISNLEIDKINIHNASLLAMELAYKNLLKKLEYKDYKVFVDGKFSPFKGAEAIIKGDSLVSEISASSIIAKNYRDSLMVKYSKIYPNYHLEKNKGYPTKVHKQAIKNYGFTEIHRKTFNFQ